MRRRYAKILMVLAIISTMIITQTACGKKDVEPVEDQSYYLDTVCKLSIYEIDGGLSEKKANKAIDAAWDRCRELDKTLSATVDTSDIGRINDAHGQWVTVSDDTVKVLKSGIKYGKISDGEFDITIGAVSSLWDFTDDNSRPPEKSKIEEALTHVDYHNIQIDGNRVRLLDPEAKIDLGGIAKGYIADEIEKVLKKKKVTSAIINLGGNIVAIGSKPDGSDFVIGIEKPYSDRSEIIGSTEVSNASVVTSGVYERQFKYKGKTYHHVLSTETGYPVDTDLDAVSLVNTKSSSMDTDAMSTICLIKGYKEGRKFIESVDGVEAVFCKSNGKNYKTKGMDFTEE
jgi:thiamine biosynthesis lipoprotein